MVWSVWFFNDRQLFFYNKPESLRYSKNRRTMIHSNKHMAADHTLKLKLKITFTVKPYSMNKTLCGYIPFTTGITD